MIRLTSGNLLQADADALVNTVNTVGVAGKGIALQFRLAFPENYKAYAAAAKAGKVVPGRMLVVPTNQLTGPRYIVNFPTKRHWKGRSRIEDIEQGLVDLVRVIAEYKIRSIAVPPLGCGNGGLDWSQVRPLVERALSPVEADVLLFPPSGAPSADDMPVSTERPRMTLGRAALIILLKQYRESDFYRLSALEVQKLAYFLQEAGEKLKLKYTKANYGPYAENLNHVLVVMEGHYTRGFGDRSETPRIKLLPGADEQAQEYLVEHPATKARMDRVARLVHGWETPYGLELLATVHWALKHGIGSTEDRSTLYGYVADWTPRKAKLFPAQHVDQAVDQLAANGFV
jgi:O-acetyl-ADP-ribose deacetylase (regulator of RNase III)